MIVGYARTSTVEQVAGLEDQIAALKAAGVERVYSEHVSSVASDRRQFEACIAWLREGDELVVTKLDRLARNVVGGLTLVRELKERGVAVRVLGSPIDTGGPNGELVLTIFLAVAQWERDTMLERQKVGIAAAKAAGKFKGRKPVARMQAPAIRDMAKTMIRADGSPDCSAIAEKLGLHRTSVWRVLQEDRPPS